MGALMRIFCFIEFFGGPGMGALLRILLIDLISGVLQEEVG